MHILIIPTPQFILPESPLEGIFQRDQAYALKRAGCTVGVVAPQLRSLRLLRRKIVGWPTRGVKVEVEREIPVYRYHGWDLVIPRLRWGKSWMWSRRGLVLFEKYVAEQGIPDIIHAHNALYAGVFASLIKNKFNVPYVLTEHSTSYARGVYHRYEIKTAARAFADADARIVVSPKLGALLETVFGKTVHPWEWIPNLLDERLEGNILKNEGQRSGGLFRFLSIGNLNERKAHSDLLKAFASQFGAEDNVQLRIGGEGPLRRQLEALVVELGMRRKVVFLGFLDRARVCAEMEMCDTFVLPSHYETFGVVLIEALACGMPVISTACKGPECIVHDENGVLVQPGDISALAEAMVTIRLRIDRYDKKRIREDCLARFGQQAVVTKLLAVYGRLSHRSNIHGMDGNELIEKNRSL